MSARPVPAGSAGAAAAMAGLAGGFACESCGSPAILLPTELTAQALVLCDQCRRPVATMAEFRSRIGQLLGGARHCDPGFSSE